MKECGDPGKMQMRFGVLGCTSLRDTSCFLLSATGDKAKVTWQRCHRGFCHQHVAGATPSSHCPVLVFTTPGTGAELASGEGQKREGNDCREKECSCGVKGQGADCPAGRNEQLLVQR